MPDLGSSQMSDDNEYGLVGLKNFRDFGLKRPPNQFCPFCDSRRIAWTKCTAPVLTLWKQMWRFRCVKCDAIWEFTWRQHPVFGGEPKIVAMEIIYEGNKGRK
jgi:hypothetical protein